VLCPEPDSNAELSVARKSKIAAFKRVPNFTLAVGGAASLRGGAAVPGARVRKFGICRICLGNLANREPIPRAQSELVRRRFQFCRGYLSSC